MLGLEEPEELIVDGLRLTVLVVVPAALALLGARAVIGGWRPPVCFEAVGLTLPLLETEDAVGAVKDEGRATGFVGDFTLGFTNPVPDS